MPFKSDKQRKYLFSQKPEVAKKFVADTKKMPQRKPHKAMSGIEMLNKGSKMVRTKK